MITDDYIVTGWNRALSNRMSGTDFEKFCADFLCAAGFMHADMTPHSSDDGIDILASRHDVTYAIQCKRRKKPIGPGIIRSTMGSMDLYETPLHEIGKRTFLQKNREYRFDYAVVMTNSVFTEKAIHTAESLNILLWDRYWIKQTADETGVILL